MFEKLNQVEKKYEELNKLLSCPGVISDTSKYREYAKLHSELENLVIKYRRYKEVGKKIEEAKQIIWQEADDHELRELAKMELDELNIEKEALGNELKLLLLPKDPNDEKNIILEIRKIIADLEPVKIIIIIQIIAGIEYKYLLSNKIK